MVDDASTDSSHAIAGQFRARLLTTGASNRGPAAARNLGASYAQGDILLFLDADVCVHPDTLQQIADEFAANPAMDALMGSYDDTPSESNFCSQYRNLMHCFFHRTGRREASTFWTGCGAIRPIESAGCPPGSAHRNAGPEARSLEGVFESTAATPVDEKRTRVFAAHLGA